MAIYLSKVLNYWRDLKGTCKRLSPKMTETTTESEQRHHLGPWSWILRTWLVRDSWLIHADPIYNMDYNMLQVNHGFFCSPHTIPGMILQLNSCRMSPWSRSKVPRNSPSLNRWRQHTRRSEVFVGARRIDPRTAAIFFNRFTYHLVNIWLIYVEIYGLYMVYIWLIYGKYMVNVWLIYG